MEQVDNLLKHVFKDHDIVITDSNSGKEVTFETISNLRQEIIKLFNPTQKES